MQPKVSEVVAVGVNSRLRVNIPGVGLDVACSRVLYEFGGSSTEARVT